MKDIARFFFIASMILFCVSALYWNSLVGVVLWRVGVVLTLFSIGLFFMWGQGKAVWIEKKEQLTPKKEKLRPKVTGLILLLSVIQLLLVSLALFSFFSIGSGLQFIVLLAVVPILMCLAALWQFLQRFWDTLLIDQMTPFLFMVIFIVPAIELSSSLILFAKIAGTLLVFGCIYAVYLNFVNLKCSMKVL